MKSKKEQILDISLSLFLEKGYDNTSISDIVTSLDIARGTLYYHFESKEAIIDAIIEQSVKEIVEKRDISKIIISMPSASQNKISNILKEINKIEDLSVKILPNVDNLIEDGKLNSDKLNPVIFLGDEHEKIYRYLRNLSDKAGKFYKNQFK